METSFFEYRNKADNDSDSEFIDNSVTEDVTYSTKKKNHTVFVAESEESASGAESEEDMELSRSSPIVRRSSVAESSLTNSRSDGSRQGSIRRHSGSSNKIVMSSSDEEELSPEMLPKRRPPIRQSTTSNESIIMKRTKKRMLLLDSDTDNSIIIEHNNNKKQTCIKDTPIKIDKKTPDESMIYDENDESYNRSGDESDQQKDKASDKQARKAKRVVYSDDDTDLSKNVNDDSKNKSVNDETDNDDDLTDDHNETDRQKNAESFNDSENAIKHSDETQDKDNNDKDDSDKILEVDNETDDDGDEDLMVMSRATRMSIMGIVPKDNESDESDFIEDDESSRKSDEDISGSLEDLPQISIQGTPRKSRSTESLPEISIHNTPDTRKSRDHSLDSESSLPEVSIHKTPEKKDPKTNDEHSSNKSLDDLPEVTIHKTPEKKDFDADSSHITCSPFNSPLQDVTNVSLNNSKITKKTEVVDLCNNAPLAVKNRISDALVKNVFDDDVTIIDTKQEVITLSSDEEDDYKVKPEKKSPRKKSPGILKEEEQMTLNTAPIQNYFSQNGPNSNLVFVKKAVRENELNKLNRLKEDLKSVRLLLDEMDLNSLPDGGSKLIERLSTLEAEVRHQGDRVASMIIEPDEPTSSDIANDGFGEGMSWDELQKASNAVQPRMFGQQAMARHNVERNLILDRLRELHASLASRPADSTQAEPPAALASTLMPHQKHALAWLKWRETQRPPAGILADDMGLGKTITMISLLASDKENKIDDDDDDEPRASKKLVRGGTLVVCPASLLQQWAEEVGKHCKPHSVSVCLHHGASRASQPHRLATHDLVVTTYHILQRDSEKNGVLMRISWRRVILDEAHVVRNHKSLTSRAVCGLTAGRRWCLTGTPVQNKDLDLFALLKFLKCSPFDELPMWKKWIDNKSMGGRERLGTVMRGLLLRRTKLQLQERGQLQCLPPRTPHENLVTLAPPEMKVYQKVLLLSSSLFSQFLKQRAEKGLHFDAHDSKKNDKQYKQMYTKMMNKQGVKMVKSHEILVLLLRLRQVCCHCGLIAAMLDQALAPEDDASADLLHELDKLSLHDSNKRKSGVGDEDEENYEGESATATEAIRAIISPKDPVFELKRPSSKIKAVMDCLNKNVFVNKGDKAVVVSQWTSVLRLVESQLSALGVRSVTLSGQVPVTARSNLIAALNNPNNDIKVLLLSLSAGGVGINLCGANHLLLLDPHWNPQLEEQAQDRIYRVGQKKEVHIYRFLCVDTVEQTIKKLQEKKLELAENVLTGSRNTAASKLSIEDLKMLFNMNS